MKRRAADCALSKEHNKRLKEFFLARPELYTTTVAYESVCADINAWFKQHCLQPVYTVQKLKKRINMCNYRKRQVAASNQQQAQADWISAAQQMAVFFPISQLPVPLVIVGSWSLQNFELLRAGFGAAASSVTAVRARCETGSDCQELQRQGVRGLDAPCLDDVCVTGVNHPVFSHETAVAVCAYEGPNLHTGFVFIEQLFHLFHRMLRGSVLLLFLRGAVVDIEWVKDCASRFGLHVACTVAMEGHTRCDSENVQAVIIIQQTSSEEELPVLQLDAKSLELLPEMDITELRVQDVTLQDYSDIDAAFDVPIGDVSVNSARI